MLSLILSFSRFPDDDDDNNGVKDIHEDKNKNQKYDFLEMKDSDGDGIPDYIDTDDDNDGKPDANDKDDDGDGESLFFEKYL